MVTEADLEWWVAKADTLRWTWAKTFGHFAPHSYVVLGTTEGMTREDFVRAGRVIWRYGVPQFYNGRPNVYLTVGNRKWWMTGFRRERTTMQEQIDLINMTDADQVFGSQEGVLDTRRHGPVDGSVGLYDHLAFDYDAMWTDPSDLAENRAVRSLIARHFGPNAPTTLDAGCGTGLLLDLGITHPSLYTGFDPSQGMLNALAFKHSGDRRVPPAALHCMTAEEYLASQRPEPRSFDLVAALFAAPSYMTPEEIRGLVPLARRLAVFMTYDLQGWLPDYYDGTVPVPMETFEAAAEACERLLDDREGYRTKIGPFDVTVVTP